MSKDENPDFAYQDDTFKNEDKIGSKSIQELKVDEDDKLQPQITKPKIDKSAKKSINSKLNEIDDTYIDNNDLSKTNNQEIENVKLKVAMESTIKDEDDNKAEKKKKKKERQLQDGD